LIKLVNVTKRFGNFTAVDDISLDVRAGEIFGFLGPNGAGKTTTLKMIVGLLKPTRGKIFINGMDICKDHVRAKKDIAFIPDKPFLYQKLTGVEFLRFICSIYGLDEDEAERKIWELLEEFHLSPWAEELIEGYSHGMKQRLVISSALIHNPKVIVVDEPMVGLDPKGKNMVKNIFLNLASQGKTVFMSTHTLELAQELCHRIAIINKGRVIAIGTMEELKEMAEEGKDYLEAIFLKLTEEWEDR